MLIMINPTIMFQVKSMWDKFTANQPKLPALFRAAAQLSMDEGTVIEVKITKSNGQSLAANVKLTAEDMELFDKIKEMYPIFRASLAKRERKM